MTRRRVAWAAAGGLFGAGLMMLSAPAIISLPPLIAGSVLLWLAYRRWQLTDSWIALTLASSVPAAVLGWAAWTREGCPAAGATVVLKEGKPAVTCAEIVASYATMSVFFGVVAVIGLATPYLARARARAQAASDYDDAAFGSS